MAHPIQACRTLPAPERRSEDEDDHEQRSRRRRRSRSLWNRLGGRSSSKSREPGLDNRSSYNQETRGRQRERAADINRSRSRHLFRSVETGETRIRRQLATPLHLSDPAPADKEQGALLMLERHLDPMLHEAMVGGSIYSPDTTLPRPASPVFVLSFAAEPQENLVHEAQHDVETFLAEVTTPIQQPLLSAPGTKLRRPCRNKHYKKPLSPADMKTITTLVENGGCKGVRLRAKKAASVVPI
ncbi:uncharacterized protein LOC127765309 [Oryza glaberrima]|uniref:uncharacterized protein LOC127765309 n=1 Tax=Oryza glaberrima TaxID=4538 RepID=UPI00224C4651|nr:uncharacterized protein LOC127765309 [Oryza glaberrima]